MDKRTLSDMALLQPDGYDLPSGGGVDDYNYVYRTASGGQQGTAVLSAGCCAGDGTASDGAFFLEQGQGKPGDQARWRRDSL